jgi:hypothetical protein
MILRSRWCNTVLNVQGPRQEKSDDSKYSFYEELKMLLEDFNAKAGRENIFKQTTGNESLHQDSNDNGVKIVNFAKV